MGRFQINLIAILIWLLNSASAAAADKPEYAVMYRQGIMNALAWNIGPLGKMLKGELDFDAARFSFLAQRAALLAPMALEGFTPDTAEVKSRVNPALWQHRDDFKDRMQALQAVSAELAKAAKIGDEANIRVVFSDTVKMCKSCHDQYQTRH